MTRIRPAALAVGLAIAAASLLVPAAARAASSPVRWSPPRLADRTPPFSSPTSILAIACPSATECLGVASLGTVVHLAGARPTTQTGLGGGVRLTGVACPSSTLCVAVGSTTLLATTDPTAANSPWRTAGPRPPDSEYDGVTCGGPSLCVAWTDSDTVEVSTDPSGSASSWHAQTLAGDISAVACVPGTTVCVASLQGSTGAARFAVSTNPASGVWTTTTATGVTATRSLACPATSLCVGTTDAGDIETSTDPGAGATTWSGSQVLSGIHTGFTGLACADASHCLAAVNDGSVLDSADPGAGAASYTRSATLDPAGFGTAADNEIACPTAGRCLIPDQTPGVATVSLGPPPSAAIAADLGGFTRIDGVACPATSLCVGVDSGGGIIRSSAPARKTGPWHRTVQPAATGGLAAIACPTTRFCAAVGADDRVATSTHPATASRWAQAVLPFRHADDEGGPPQRYDLTSISCPSATFCLVGNDEYGLMVSGHPGGGASAWRFVKLAAFNADFWDAVSCPTSRFCVAGDGNFGRVAVSTHPTRSGRAWRLSKIAPGVGSQAPGISAVSCPSTRFCLAADARGTVHWSTRPAGGPRAWHAARIDHRRLVAASCRSAHLCVAIDGSGAAFDSTDPERGGRSWHRTVLATHRLPIAGAGQQSLTALACAPHRLCLAASGIGAVFAGATR